jgi:hypothetical protein
MLSQADTPIISVPTVSAYVRFKGRLWRVPKAFRGERLALRPLTHDGHYGVFFASHQVTTIDLTDPKTCQSCVRTGVRHVPGLNTCARDDSRRGRWLDAPAFSASPNPAILPARRGRRRGGRLAGPGAWP